MRIQIPALAVPLVLFHFSIGSGQTPELPAATSTSASDDAGVSTMPGTDASASTEGIEYLTRGPLHEAFAEPYVTDVVPSVVIDKEPPPTIDELPPEYRPDAENVDWIPGYWAWDEEREDFLWVSGIWRQFPPNHRWVPGYWTNVDGGYQRIGGFWAGIEVADVQYLPTPPATLEQGPSSPPPADDHFYVPGNWVYESEDYRWQPGFWTRAQQNWVWTPAQYVWTPRGCIYRQGYWDYDVAYRGVVFTPVYFQRPVHRSPIYTYRPRYTIDTGLGLFVHLFVRPNHGSYYFGDYYGPRYAQQYRPWVTNFSQAQNYDPFYAHYRYLPTYREANALTWITTQHRYFETDQKYRPPRTIEAQRQFVRTNQSSEIAPTVLRLATFGESFGNLVEQNESAFNFHTVAAEDIQTFRERTTPLRELSAARQKLETSAERNQAANRGRNLSERLPTSANQATTDLSPGKVKSDIGPRLSLPPVNANASLPSSSPASEQTSNPADPNDFEPSIGRPNTANASPIVQGDETNGPETNRDTNRLRDRSDRMAGDGATRPGLNNEPLRPSINGDTSVPPANSNATGAGRAIGSSGVRTQDNTSLNPGVGGEDTTPGQVKSSERNSRAMQQRADANAESRARTGGQLPPENDLRSGRNGVGNLRAGDAAGSTSPNPGRIDERMRPPRPQDWPGGATRRNRSTPLPGTPGPKTVSPSAIPSDRRQPDAQQSTIEGTREARRPSSLPTIDGRGPGPRGSSSTPPIGRGTFENLDRGNGPGNGRVDRPKLPGAGKGQ